MKQLRFLPPTVTTSARGLLWRALEHMTRRQLDLARTGELRRAEEYAKASDLLIETLARILVEDSRR